MRVYEASALISAEFGGIRDLSRHLSLNYEGGTKELTSLEVRGIAEPSVPQN